MTCHNWQIIKANSITHFSALITKALSKYYHIMYLKMILLSTMFLCIHFIITYEYNWINFSLLCKHFSGYITFKLINHLLNKELVFFVCDQVCETFGTFEIWTLNLLNSEKFQSFKSLIDIISIRTILMSYYWAINYSALIAKQYLTAE
jgi:hypothetical protein